MVPTGQQFEGLKFSIDCEVNDEDLHIHLTRLPWQVMCNKGFANNFDKAEVFHIPHLIKKIING